MTVRIVFSGNGFTVEKSGIDQLFIPIFTYFHEFMVFMESTYYLKEGDSFLCPQYTECTLLDNILTIIMDNSSDTYTLYL